MSTDSIQYRQLSRTLPIVFFIFGIWYFCLRILGFGLDYIPGDLGDSRFINYLLEHGFQWLNGSQSEFWNATFMYPQQNTIAISDNMIGTLPIYAIFRWTGLSIEASYQLWWITICSLNYWCTYFILKRWLNRWDLAIIGAWIFAFTIFNMGQLNYMQMTIRFMIPIVIYSAAKMVETASLKHLLIYSVGITYQFFCVVYTGFFLAYFSLGFLVLYALLNKNLSFIFVFFRKDKLKYTLPIVLFPLLALLLLMLPYVQVSNELGLRLFGEVKYNLPVWQAYLYADSSSVAWHFMNETFRPKVTNWWLQSTFIGIVPLLVVLSVPFLWIYWKIRKIKVPRLLLATTVTVFIISLLFLRTSEGITLYALIFKLPGMNSMRVLNRFMHVELFFIILILLLLLRKMNIHWSILLMALIFIDNSFVPGSTLRERKSTIQLRRDLTKKIVTKSLNASYNSFALIDPNSKPYETHIDAMLVSLELGIPTINGYSSSCPDEFGEFFIHNNENGLKSWIKKKNLKKESILIIKKKSTN